MAKDIVRLCKRLQTFLSSLETVGAISLQTLDAVQCSIFPVDTLDVQCHVCYSPQS